MEEVKTPAAKKAPKKKRDVKRRLIDGGTDLTLRVLALIIAIIIWFVLSITQYPTVNKTVTGVHVDFSLSGTVAEERGLEALNYQDLTVDVEIRGMNYEIGNYNDNDLYATVNLDEVTKQGTYTLEIEVRSTHTTDRVTIVSVTPETVEVDFDRLTTKTLPLTAEAPYVSAKEGFTLRQNGIMPSEVTVSGPEAELDKMSRAAVRIDTSEVLTEDTTLSSDKLIYYDEDDNKLDDSKISAAEASFDVSFEVYKKKTVELRVDVTNTPEGFDEEGLPMKLSTDSISVITPDLDDEDTETMTVGSVPLTNITPYSTFSFPVTLGAGEIDLDGVDTVTASLDSEGYGSKTFELTSDRIKLVGAPAGFVSELGTAKLSGITIYGPDEEVAALTDEDIYAQVDISDITKSGSYTKEALIYPKDSAGCWSYGIKTVQVNVALPPAESESSSESE